MAATVAVTGKLTGPDGQGVAFTTITATPNVTAAITDTGEVVGPASVITAVDGTYSLPLYRNADLTPANSSYVVRLAMNASLTIVVTGAGTLRSMVISSAPLPILDIPESQVINLVGDLGTLTASVAALGGGAGGAVISVAGRGGVVVLAEADIASLTTDLATLTTGVGTNAAAITELETDIGEAIPESQVTGLVSDLALKAPLASPAFTGVPTFPAGSIAAAALAAIPESGVTNLTTDLAAKALAARQVASGTGLTGGGDLTADRTLAVSYGTAAGTAAQGNDSRFTAAIPESQVTSLASDLALKAPLASPTFTGTVTVPTSSNSTDAAQKADVTVENSRAAAAEALKAPLTDSRFTQVAANLRTASYTLVLTDAGLVVEMNLAGANTLTVPTNASVAFPVGTILEVFQVGAGQCTITAAGGVTFRSDGAKVKTAAQYASVSLRKRGTDEWVLAGDLA